MRKFAAKPNRTKKNSSIHIWIDSDLKDRVLKAAKKADCTRTYFIEQALEFALENME